MPTGISTGIVAGMDTAYKTNENRIRRIAARQGMRLEKAKVRDTRATNYQTYRLVDAEDGSLVAWGVDGYGLTLDEVEGALEDSMPTAWRWNASSAAWEGPESRLDSVGFHLTAEYDDDKGVHFWAGMERESEEYTLTELRSIHRAIGRVLDKVDASPKPTRP